VIVPTLFLPTIKHIDPDSGGLELLGSPVLLFFDPFISSQIDKMCSVPDKPALLEDPQLELHLLISCLSVC